VNLHPKTVKDSVDVPKGGEADGVALTPLPLTPKNSLGPYPNDPDADMDHRPHSGRSAQISEH
jgi:hypothetical protein